MYEDFEKQLISQAKEFLSTKNIQVENVIIEPKEIEVYYYNETNFPDNSVHCNELQKNNSNHFYVHRYGIRKDDKYKGGRRPGVDLVISANSDYYSYLIRSAYINGENIIGPNNVLKAILEAIGLTEDNRYSKLEEINIQIVDKENAEKKILTSERINLGQAVVEAFRSAQLRFVVCDSSYRNTPYLQKERLFIPYLKNLIENEGLTKEQAQDEARNYLGYIPKEIKDLF